MISAGVPTSLSEQTSPAAEVEGAVHSSCGLSRRRPIPGQLAADPAAASENPFGICTPDGCGCLSKIPVIISSLSRRPVTEPVSGQRCGPFGPRAQMDHPALANYVWHRRSGWKIQR
jgi:hypothetical protein